MKTNLIMIIMRSDKL